jgi:hypothetical protein
MNLTMSSLFQAPCLSIRKPMAMVEEHLARYKKKLNSKSLFLFQVHSKKDKSLFQNSVGIMIEVIYQSE